MRHHPPFSACVLTYCLVAFFSFSCETDSTYSTSTNPAESSAHVLTVDQLLEEFQASETDLLATWYPRVIDNEDGGYLTDFDANWKLDGLQNKMIVTQARHVWTTAQAAMKYPDNPDFLEMSRHGFHFLRDQMWDHEHGGFYQMVDKAGNPILNGANALKTAYGNAFGIYGLAALAQASGDEEALSFAQKAFTWLDSHSHDPDYLGYFQFLEQDGTPRTQGNNGTPPKDQNSSIHLLEAFTQLYLVWPDETVRSRLEEMLTLVRGTMVHDQKYLQLFFYQDWTPLSYRDSTEAARNANLHFDHVSVGHDIETAFLMLEAARALGIPEEETLNVGKSMVDHALQVGWDSKNGGFYDYVYYLAGDTEATLLSDTKNWWAQAEGLNSLLLMHTLFPNDPNQYFDKFEQQWAFVNDHLIDQERGGWYSGSLDKEPNRINGAKSHIWKGPYHTVRSLMHSADMLKSLHSTH